MPFLRMLSEAEVASMLKLSLRTMQRMRKREDGITYAKIGRAIRYSPADVDTYIREHEYQPTEAGKCKSLGRMPNFQKEVYEPIND
jgi:methylphosphotriester-DNA--protein-cysteine methyltransferase